LFLQIFTVDLPADHNVTESEITGKSYRFKSSFTNYFETPMCVCICTESNVPYAFNFSHTHTIRMKIDFMFRFLQWYDNFILWESLSGCVVMYFWFVHII